MKAKKLGEGQRQVLLLGDLPSFRLSERGNILIEEEIEGQVRLFLENHTVIEAAEKLGVCRNVILFLRKQ